MNKTQKDILRYIKSFIKKNGYSPTNDEIMETVGLKSRPMVNHYLNGLELLGKIKRNKYKHRNISVCQQREIDSDYVKKIRQIYDKLGKILEDLE